MPSVSKAQQRLAGADLARKRAGKKTRTGMSKVQLAHYASTPRKGLPAKAKAHPKGMPPKKMPMHKMPGGHMMKNSEMGKHMKAKPAHKQAAKRTPKKAKR